MTNKARPIDRVFQSDRDASPPHPEPLYSLPELMSQQKVQTAGFVFFPLEWSAPKSLMSRNSGSECINKLGLIHRGSHGNTSSTGSPKLAI